MLFKAAAPLICALLVPVVSLAQERALEPVRVDEAPAVLMPRLFPRVAESCRAAGLSPHDVG